MIRDNALRNLFADNPVRRPTHLSCETVSMSESALDGLGKGEKGSKGLGVDRMAKDPISPSVSLTFSSCLQLTQHRVKWKNFGRTTCEKVI